MTPFRLDSIPSFIHSVVVEMKRVPTDIDVKIMH